MTKEPGTTNNFKKSKTYLICKSISYYRKFKTNKIVKFYCFLVNT